MSNKKLWIVVGILGTGIALGAAAFIASQSKSPATTAKRIQAERRTLIEKIESPGTVMPRNRVEILPPINGRVDTILVSEGDHVRPGQMLAIMSSTDRAVLLDAANYQTSQEKAYWESVYQPTRIYAPLRGQVIVRSVEPGQTVNTGMAMLVLSDALVIKAQVDETDIGKIRVGIPALVSLDAYSGKPISGRIQHISFESTIVNNVTIYEVTVQLNQIPEYYRSGMTATIQFILDEKENVLAVPDQAIRYRNNHAYLLAQAPAESGSKPARISIQTGLSADGWTEIISDQVSDGDSFLLPTQNTALPDRKRGLMSFRGGGRR